MILFILFCIFVISKIVEKFIKFTRSKIYIKMKSLNNILFGFLIFYCYLLFIDFYIFLSIELTNFTSTNVYESPVLILIINICILPLNEVVLKGFKINLNLFINNDVYSYAKWFRNYLICVIVLYLDLFLR